MPCTINRVQGNHHEDERGEGLHWSHCTKQAAKPIHFDLTWARPANRSSSGFGHLQRNLSHTKSMAFSKWLSLAFGNRYFFMWTYFAFDGFCFVLPQPFEREKNEKWLKHRSLWQLNFFQGHHEPVDRHWLPAKSSSFTKTARQKVPFFLEQWGGIQFHSIGCAERNVQLSIKKKNHNDLNNTCSANYGFVKHKNYENARKQRERTPSVRTLGPCGAAMAKKKILLRPSSFLLRRSPSNVRSVMPLHVHMHSLLIGHYDYQACSVGLKMDVYMHRLQESGSQSTVNRLTEFEVTTSLRRNSVCRSVILGYGVKYISWSIFEVYFFFAKADGLRGRVQFSLRRRPCSRSHRRSWWCKWVAVWTGGFKRLWFETTTLGFIAEKGKRTQV